MFSRKPRMGDSQRLGPAPRIAIVVIGFLVATVAMVALPASIAADMLSWTGFATAIIVSLTFLKELAGPAPGLGFRHWTRRAYKITTWLILLTGAALVMAITVELINDRDVIMSLDVPDRAAHFESRAVIFHALSASAVSLLLVLFGVVTWKQQAKADGWLQIIRLQRALQDSFPWPIHDATKAGEDALKTLREALIVLEENLDRGIPGVFYGRERKRRGPRWVTVWVPNTKNQCFEFVESAYSGTPYQQLNKKYRPKMHQGEEHTKYLTTVPKFITDYRAAASQTDKRKLVADQMDAKAKVTSLSGAVFARAIRKTVPEVAYIEDDLFGAMAYVEDMDAVPLDDPYFENKHEREILGKLHLRTLYIRPLAIRSEYLGLLLIADPIVDALFMRDADLLEAGVHILETLLCRHLAAARLLGRDPWQRGANDARD